MAELHPSVECVDDGDTVELYGPRVGRAATLASATLALAPWPAPVAARLARLGLLADDDRSVRVVVRHRATLLLPDVPALWAPVPTRHGAGGHAYREVPLDAVGLALWRGINDRRTVQQLADHVGLPVDACLARLTPWMDRSVQAVQLRDRPPGARDPGLERLVGPARDRHARTADQHGAAGETTLAAYHLEAIDDGATHFDDRETTVAHALARPHPGLRGVPYGTALRRRLGHDGPVVEVGCGTGELAAAWQADGEVPYLRLDLSPTLLATQARAAPSTAGALADATRLPLRDGSVPFLLSNEVLADLGSVPLPTEHPEVRAWCARFGLAPTGWANLGAWQMVAEVARVLAPGGRAVLTEFGTLGGAAEEAEQLDHPEVSIDFALLAHLATALGLQAELVRLDTLLGLDLHARQLSRTSWRALRARARSLSHALSARAWTADTVPLPFAVEGLVDTTLADEGPGPLVTRFYALMLSR